MSKGKGAIVGNAVRELPCFVVEQYELDLRWDENLVPALTTT
jgi:hypothetical protein